MRSRGKIFQGHAGCDWSAIRRAIKFGAVRSRQKRVHIPTAAPRSKRSKSRTIQVQLQYLSCLRHKVASQSPSKLISIYKTNLRNGCIYHQQYSIICRVGHPRTNRLCRQRPLHSLLELFCEELQTPQRPVLQLRSTDVIVTRVRLVLESFTDPLSSSGNYVATRSLVLAHAWLIMPGVHSYDLLRGWNGH